jgi:hypothetical protein
MPEAIALIVVKGMSSVKTVLNAVELYVKLKLPWESESAPRFRRGLPLGIGAFVAVLCMRFRCARPAQLAFASLAL